MKLTGILLLLFSTSVFAMDISVTSLIRSNFKTVSTNENVASNNNFISIRQKLKETTLAFNGGFTVNLDEVEEKVNLIDPSIGLINSFKLFDQVLISSLNWRFPFSKFSRENQESRGSLGHALTKSNIFTVFDRRLTLSLTVQNNINFHRFVNNKYGQSNNRHRHGVSLSTSYQIDQKVSINHSMGLIKNVTYGGIATDSYWFSDSLNITFGDLNVSAGFDSSGAILAANGMERNIQYFDLDLSTFYLGLTVNF